MHEPTLPYYRTLEIIRTNMEKHFPEFPFSACVETALMVEKHTGLTAVFGSLSFGGFGEVQQTWNEDFARSLIVDLSSDMFNGAYGLNNPRINIMPKLTFRDYTPDEDQTLLRSIWNVGSMMRDKDFARTSEYIRQELEREGLLERKGVVKVPLHILTRAGAGFH